MIDFAAARERMIAETIVGRGLDDPALAAAFRAVPREEFVAEADRVRAYGDHPLPIAAGQTISQPYIVALTIAAAGIAPGDRVLEVGAGSGYAAAVISRIAGEVVTIERHAELAEAAAARLARLGFANVRVVTGDGMLGYPQAAPYNAIVAAAAGSEVPAALVAQLAEGGALVMPIGGRHSIQSLVRLTKRPGGGLVRESICGVRFVPLVAGLPA